MGEKTLIPFDILYIRIYIYLVILCLFVKGRGYHFTLNRERLSPHDTVKHQASPSTFNTASDSDGSKTLGTFCVRDWIGHEIVIQFFLPGS